MTRHHPLLDRARAFTPALLLTLVSGIGAAIPVQALPSSLPRVAALSATPAASSTAPASASTAALAGEVQLSPTPPNQTQAVAPNIVMTFDDSGSMNWSRLSDSPPYTTDDDGNQISGLPDWSDGPWRCANVVDPDHPKASDAALRALAMNGVYYNPNITYVPPYYANGKQFPNADATLKAVWVDGMTVNRPLNPVTVDTGAKYNNNPDLDYPDAGSLTNLMGTKGTKDRRWRCGTGGSNEGQEDGWTGSSPMDGKSHTLSDGTTVTYPNDGPYYYRLKTGVTVNLDKYGKPATSSDLAALYKASNWEAVPVPSSQYQNFANWYAYYRTRNQMARTSISRVFGSGSLYSENADGSVGSTIRVAWQNLYSDDPFRLQTNTIISSLIDADPSDCANSEPSLGSQSIKSGTVKTAPSCYRSDFFNWLFQVPASSGTPTRSALVRAGEFFKRGYDDTGASGDLHDPYWQPPVSGSGDGNELACRQNYQMLVTDGLWNGNDDGPQYSDLTLPASGLQLPDGVTMPDPASAGVTSIYSPVHDGGDDGYASLSDIAFNYWATDLRPDLYKPASGDIVTPYLPDTTKKIFSLSGTTSSSVKATQVNPEVYFNPKNDPATWPHMSEYLVGLGVSGQLNFSEQTDCEGGVGTNTTDACLLRQGITNSSNAVGWPTPNGNGSGIAANIDDTWHAALAGRGQFFSAGNPKQLVDQLSKILTNISARNVPPSTEALNTSVLVPGALAFTTGYNAADWSGTLQALQANTDGSVGTTPLWDAGAQLTDASVTDPTKRNILTAKENADGSFGGGIAFESSSTFDTAAQAELMLPAPTDATNDTLANRIDYLRGVRTEEAKGVMRTRTSLLGAIIDSQAIYVAYPASGYLDNWPATSPEAKAEAAAAKAGTTTDDGSYEQFVENHVSRKPMVYVGANDGMLHAFDASETDSSDTPPKVVPTSTAGDEVFAYVPRSVYDNLGNLTSNNFSFMPTVDGSPVTRDVFFDAATASPAVTTAGWHTILVGNLRGGGRGVYALDITDPSQDTEANASKKVLWEFNSDTPAPTTGCYASYGSCNPADLGFTYGEPNIARLPDGKWVVLVPGGYFPDCSKAPYTGSNCPTPAGAPTAGSPAVAFSSLFVLDAQTGAMIAELKTPTSLSGVTSYGLGSPVLGSYGGGQVDDVAFAGDLAGNVWRYDLSSSTESNWTVSLLYQPTTQGAQPITSMPRLLPDPATNRFMVVFGTGKYLGTNDNTSTGVPTQAIYGIRDLQNASGGPVTVSGTTNLEAQTLAEQIVTTGTGASAVTNTLRGLTNNPVSSTQDGWYIPLNLSTEPGERVVLDPVALFDSNRVVVTTLIPSTNDPCTATITGAVMVLDAANGGSGQGLTTPSNSSWTGTSTLRVVGGLVNNPPTTGTLPIATQVGGASSTVVGHPFAGGGQPIISQAVWRRRSWGELDNDQ